ncbi:MAG: tRNA methyl transferase PRC-barrel domain-containing protein, partial [Solirubrobacteraceae bacterium]
LYTVGQRHGLGVSAAEPLYVLATDAHTNIVTVGPRRALLADAVNVEEATLHRDGACVDGVRVRAHGRRFACSLPRDPRAGRHASLAVELAEPAERTAPGQFACLYAGEVVVGYGTVAT